MNHRMSTAKGVLLLFALCAVFDLLWGYSRGHSLSAAVISIVGGLFSTALFALLFVWGRKGKHDTDGNH
jgi:O-antigen/teichoic acid export membrane protein